MAKITVYNVHQGRSYEEDYQLFESAPEAISWTHSQWMDLASKNSDLKASVFHFLPDKMEMEVYNDKTGEVVKRFVITE